MLYLISFFAGFVFGALVVYSVLKKELDKKSALLLSKLSFTLCATYKRMG